MSLLPRGQREQLLVFVGVLGVLGAGAYWYFLHQPKSVALEEKGVHLEALVAVNQKARAEIARGSVEQLRAQLAAGRQTLSVLRQLIPTSNEVPALLEAVSNAARREGLDLSVVTPQPVIAGAQFDTHRYDLGVVGNYHALAAFLTNVGSLSRIVAPVNLKLLPPTNAQAAAGKAKGGAAIEARFQIQTYVARTGAGDDDETLPVISAGGK
jgi:type IV pilus assembly protein PilO